jgi:flagellar basal-body rod protein FlgC
MQSAREGGNVGVFDVFRIGASGLSAQRLRMESIATNLANIHTTRTDEGGPFRKKEVVFVPTDDVSGKRDFGSILQKKFEGVKVEEVTESEKPFERTYDPFHPDADKDGYVTFPNVNVMSEMSDMIAATRAYEANVNVINNAKDMFMKSLEIGR